MWTFRDFVLSVFPPLESEWWRAETSITEHTAAKGEALLASGQICDRVIFIKSGIARSHRLDAEGRDFTWYFHFNDDNARMHNLFAIDFASFTTAEPSQLSIEALSEVTFEAIPRDKVEAIYRDSPLWREFGRLMAEQAYNTLHHRVLSLLSESAQERYRRLLQECPDLLAKVPHYHIASYLSITPQSLSRIRREIAAPEQM